MEIEIHYARQNLRWRMEIDLIGFTAGQDRLGT